MDDDELIERFENGSFPFEEWNHRVYLKLAYLYLSRHTFEDAVGRMRQGLRQLIRMNHVPDTPTSGYHETVTVAWMHLVSSAIQRQGAAPNSDLFLERHAQLGDKDILRLFYSARRLLSPQAKESFVEPDLAPFPQSRPMVGEPAGIPRSGG